MKCFKNFRTQYNNSHQQLVNKPFYLSIATEAGVTAVNVINIPKNNKMINKYITSQDPVHFPVRAVPSVSAVGFMCKRPSVTHVQLL